MIALLHPGRDAGQVSSRIKDVLHQHIPDGVRETLFLHPMARWHLYGEFKNGESTGGRIQFVWLFGLIGGFVLLLAALNFMNLSTARSATRAREVGIRKAIGSMRIQLVGQFLSESWLVVTLAFGVSLLLVQLVLPAFNQLAGKHAVLPWDRPAF
jgi:hypothetical protein